jgi:hypothetical protein
LLPKTTMGRPPRDRAPPPPPPPPPRPPEVIIKRLFINNRKLAFKSSRASSEQFSSVLAISRFVKCSVAVSTAAALGPGRAPNAGEAWHGHCHRPARRTGQRTSPCGERRRCSRHDALRAVGGGRRRTRWRASLRRWPRPRTWSGPPPRASTSSTSAPMAGVQPTPSRGRGGKFGICGRRHRADHAPPPSHRSQQLLELSWAGIGALFYPQLISQVAAGAIQTPIIIFCMENH